MSLPALSVRNPVFAWMLMLGFLVFGGISFFRLGVGQYPDVDLPYITITATREGAAPEIMESEVIDEIENAVMAVEGIREITSTAKQGSATVTVEFEIERNIDIALQDVQARVSAAIKLLPKDMDPPSIQKVNPEENPIMWVAVTGNRSPLELAQYAKNSLRDRFLTVPGDGDVRMGGYLERNARIWIDPDKLIARGLAVDDVIKAIQRQHVEGPAGRMEGHFREANVRMEGEAINVAEMRKLVIASPDGHPIYLSDVALVEDGFEDKRKMARVDGISAQGMGIIKQHGANSVQLADDVRARLVEINKTIPQGMQITVRADSTKAIRAAINNTEETLIHSVLLTALVCWLFLGSFSSTFNVLLAIPVSVCGTFAVMYFMNFTLNTFSLLALSLSIGIVVDDAVMVLENIYRHAEIMIHKNKHLPLKARVNTEKAAREGAEEISFAALAATLAIVAIFLPIAFVSGIIGKFLFQFGVVLSVAVAISLLEALTIAPARSAQFIAVSERGNFVERAAHWVFDRVTKAYRWLLALALHWRVTIVTASVGIFVSSMFLFPLIGKELTPAQDQGVFIVTLTMPVGSTINYTDKVMRDAETILRKHDEIDSVFTVVGGFTGEADNGLFFITTKDPELRPKGTRETTLPDGTKKTESTGRPITQLETINALRKEMNIFPGTRVITKDLSTALPGSSPRGGGQVEFSIRGPDWAKLGELSSIYLEEMRKTGKLADLNTDYRVGMPEVRVYPNRERALALNVDVQSLSDTISALVGGNKIAKFTDDGKRYDIRLRLLRAERGKPEDILNLYVRNKDGDLVKLSEVVSVETKPSLPSITRQSRERAVNLSLNPGPGFTQQGAIDEVNRIAAEKLPEGYKIVFGGSAKTFKESSDSLKFALCLGIIIAYMILASQFNSFLHPFTVLMALPFSLTGALAALYWTGQTINMYSMIGVILLMGLVKKNSILLIDFTIQKREKGMARDAALLEACPTRLRPILMTTSATIAGAIPGAINMGAGGELLKPMSIAVIGGLIVSTTLTLFVVPCVYSLTDQLVSWVTGKKLEDKFIQATQARDHDHAPTGAAGE